MSDRDARPFKSREDAEAWMRTDEARAAFEKAKGLVRQHDDGQQWFVTATVVAHITAPDEAEAMQALCDRLHPGVVIAAYDVAEVNAKRLAAPDDEHRGPS